MSISPGKAPTAALSNDDPRPGDFGDVDNDDDGPPLPDPFCLEVAANHDEEKAGNKKGSASIILGEDAEENDGPLIPIAQLQAAMFNDGRATEEKEAKFDARKENSNVDGEPDGAPDANDDGRNSLEDVAVIPSTPSEQLSANEGATSSEVNNEAGVGPPPSRVGNEPSRSAEEAAEGEGESLPILEGTLVDENEARVQITYLQRQAEPVYPAERIENVANRPWRKRNQGYLVLGILLLAGAIAIGVIVVVSDKSDGARPDGSAIANEPSSTSPSSHPTAKVLFLGNVSSLEEGQVTFSSPFPSQSPSAPPPAWEQLGGDIYSLAHRDYFGNSLALSADGKTLVVGAPHSRSVVPGYNSDGTLYFSTHDSAGQFRVFGWDNSTATLDWRQTGDTIDGEAKDWLGWSVDISADGKIVAVGAKYSKDCNLPKEYCFAAGQVKVYEYNALAMGWNQLGSSIVGEDENDLSGHSVALSSDGLTVAVGAPANGGNGFCSGHVRVYKWIGSDWSQVGQDIHGRNVGDEAGYAVALSEDGSTLAVGSPYNDGNGDNSGMVQVYQWNDNSYDWAPLGKEIGGEDESDQSGQAVALSADGMTVAIGAIYNDGIGTNRAGHARVYKWDGDNNWRQAGDDIDGEAARDQSGWSIDLSADGHTVAIGAIYNDGSGVDSGHVRVYRWNESSLGWSKLGQDIDGDGVGAMTGQSVSISADGSIVAIGSIGADIGQVRVFHMAGR
mmetsp:Transcript_29834/g.63355  ORF Transcript_29834/g.63355 Transcript_29834/m.63355 type:complete len:730 (-) Transcript_29834:275-2464(-)